MSYGVIGQDSNHVKSNNDIQKRLKLKKGETKRVGIIPLNEAPDGTLDFVNPFIGAETHYYEGPGGVGKSFVCKKDICCSHNYKGNTPSWKILTALAVYTITAGPDGKASMSGLEVIPWRFNAQTFESLKGLKDDTPWDSWDLQLTCTNEDFQTYAITPKKGSLWQQDGDLKAKCIAGAAKVKKQARFHIAADLSIADISELFGLGGNETVAMGGDIDLSGIADGL